jgi:hypothetical protein
MSVTLHNNISVRMLGYQMENEVENLREFSLNLISKIVCVTGYKIVLSHKFENEIWHTKMCAEFKTVQFMGL